MPCVIRLDHMVEFARLFGRKKVLVFFFHQGFVLKKQCKKGKTSLKNFCHNFCSAWYNLMPEQIVYSTVSYIISGVLWRGMQHAGRYEFIWKSPGDNEISLSRGIYFGVLFFFF